MFSILFTIDLRATKLIYGVGRKGNSCSSKELDAVWNTIMCLQLLSPGYSLLRDHHHYTIFIWRFMTHMINLKDELDSFSLILKRNVFLLNIKEACISITSPLYYQVLNKKLDSGRKNHCTVDHHCILLCPSS